MVIIDSNDPLGLKQPCSGARLIGTRMTPKGEVNEWDKEVYGLADLKAIMKETNRDIELLKEGRYILLV